jgi:crossover junction endodeoxyribonuclease RuvC
MGSSSRQLWKAYVEGRAVGRKQADVKTNNLRLAKFRGTVMGIDPSLRGTGLSVVEFREGDVLTMRHRETVRIPASRTYMDCLATICDRCEQVAREFHVDHVAVEQPIYVQNFRTALILGSAKGAALGVLAKAGFPIFEYAPLRVKQAIVGSGRASKEQVAEMVSRFLSHAEWANADETDAAAVAICHGFTHRVADGPQQG